MATQQHEKLVRHVRQMAENSAYVGESDSQLHARFTRTKDPEAFAELVQRYGRLVYEVCRQKLPDVHDVEDAFQATFLVLARKPASLKRPEALRSWLWGIARRTASRSQADIATRRAHERNASELRGEIVHERDESADLRRLLYRELERLPALYREPIRLCHLNEVPRKGAAEQLGIPEGTVSSRLNVGLKLLRERCRCKLSVSSAALSSMLIESTASANIPASLIASTVTGAMLYASGRTTTGVVSAQAVILADETLKSLAGIPAFLKIATTILVIVTLTVGTGAYCRPTQELTEGTAHTSQRTENPKPQAVGQSTTAPNAPQPLEKHASTTSPLTEQQVPRPFVATGAQLSEFVFPKDRENVAQVFRTRVRLAPPPQGHHLWLAVRESGLWYPREDITSFGGREYECIVDQINVPFDLVVISVTPQSHHEIVAWIRPQNNSWPGRDLTHLPETREIAWVTELGLVKSP